MVCWTRTCDIISSKHDDTALEPKSGKGEVAEVSLSGRGGGGNLADAE